MAYFSRTQPASGDYLGGILRTCHTRFLLAGTVFALAVAVIAPCSAIAASPGTNGWYWPTGTENCGGMSGWWDFRGNCWHLAQDMRAIAGSPVFSAADGTVLESKYVSGYGPGGGEGGAVVILHKTATGAEFKALYGHLSSLRYHEGDRVRAGAVIGVVNGSSPNHLHFGINPGRAYPRDNNPFRGHTYTSSNTYGFVDPVAFLRHNYRILPYRPPSVPVVLTACVSGTPTAYGVARGSLYWMLQSMAVALAEAPSSDTSGTPDASATPGAEDATNTITVTDWWTCPVTTGRARLLGEEEAVPTFDRLNYTVSMLASPVRLVVRDRKPRVSLAASAACPSYGQPVAVAGRVTNASAAVFVGASVAIDRRDAGGWRQIATAKTGVDGRFTSTLVVSRRTSLRARFVPPRDFTVACSSTIAITPRVAVLTPSTPSTILRGTRCSATGTLRPRHAAGSSAIVTEWQRYAGSEWVTVVRRTARLTDAGSGASAYAATVACASGGRWRVRAVHASCDAYAFTASAWRYLVVR